MASDFPPSWQMMLLEDCMEAIIDYRGKTPKKSVSGIPVLSAKVIKGGRIEWENQEYIPFEDYDTWMRRGLPKKGDVVMTTEGPLGEIAQLDGRKVALGQRIVTLRGKLGLLDNSFLKYLMMSNYFQHELQSRATGTTVEGIKQTTLRQIWIPIPSIQEQVSIAAILSSFDDKIELNRRMNATLEATARALFKSWFVDFDPVRARMEGRQPEGMDAETAALFPDRLVESALGLIPEGWRVEPLPQTIDFLEGPGIRNWQYTNSEEGIRFINIRCIQDGDLILDTANRVTEDEAHGKYSHFQLEELDLVVSTSGTLGRFAVVRREHLPLILNTSVIRLRPKTGELTREFLWCYVGESAFQQELITRASGSVQRNFGPMHLKQISMLCPPFQLLMHFSNIIQPMYRKLLECRSENDLLAAARDALLPKLVSGQVRVGEFG